MGVTDTWIDGGSIVAVEPSIEPQDFPPSGGREERSQGVPQL